MPQTISSLPGLVTVALLASGCDLYGMVAGPDDYNRHYLADELICSIDSSIHEELDRKSPNGYLTREFSIEIWSEYWNERVHTLSGANLHQDYSGYVGPSGRELLLYALGQRRRQRLPDLSASSETRPAVASLYAELGNSTTSVCAYLGGRDPQCSLSPAQYPGSPDSRRLTRRCSGPATARSN